MSVRGGVERDLTDMPRRASESALAQLALELANQLDDPSNSATSKSMCAKALNDTMAQLRALAPPKREKDGLDDLSARRAARRAAAS